MQIQSRKSYNDARRFFEERCDSNRLKLHSECVIDACMLMINGTTLNTDVFVIAGWLHDVSRDVDCDNHHWLGVQAFERFLELHPEYRELEEEVRDCILNHRTGGDPETRYGLLFRTADKVSLQDHKWLEHRKHRIGA